MKAVFAIIVVLFVGLVYFKTKTPDSQAVSKDLKTVKRPWPAMAPESEQETMAANPSAKNYYVVFDGSGSMNETGCSDGKSKIVVAKDALRVFAKNVPADANLGLTVFDDRGVRELVPLGIDNRDEFITQVDQIMTGGGTPLRSAMELGAKRLESQARRQQAYGEYNLVIVTDGQASDGENPQAVVDDLLLSTPVSVSTIGFCISGDHVLNQPGRTVYKAANQPEDVSKGLEEVLAESETFDVTSFGK